MIGGEKVGRPKDAFWKCFPATSIRGSIREVLIENAATIGNAFDLANQARQDAYDLTIKALGEVLTGAQVRELLRLITDEGFAALQAKQPRLATQIMQTVRTMPETEAVNA